MKKILSNPEIASILKTPDIQRLLQALKEEPLKAQKYDDISYFVLLISSIHYFIN